MPVLEIIVMRGRVLGEHDYLDPRLVGGVDNFFDRAAAVVRQARMNVHDAPIVDVGRRKRDGTAVQLQRFHRRMYGLEMIRLQAVDRVGAGQRRQSRRHDRQGACRRKQTRRRKANGT